MYFWFVRPSGFPVALLLCDYTLLLWLFFTCGFESKEGSVRSEGKSPTELKKKSQCQYLKCFHYVGLEYNTFQKLFPILLNNELNDLMHNLCSCPTFISVLSHELLYLLTVFSVVSKNSTILQPSLPYRLIYLRFRTFCIEWQLLAGMIAEPAFLSEYTIFALDPTKQPKPQSDGVVSPPTPLSDAFRRGRRVLY